MLNILIMGAGAIGCFVGGSLVAAGHRVTLVGRQPLKEKIARDGIILRWPERADQTVFPTVVTNVEGAKTAAPYDFIILTVKSPAVSAAAEQLATLSPKSGETYVVSLQNGVGSEEQLAAVFTPKTVIAGTITIPIRLPELGVIEVSKLKGGLGLASLMPPQPVQILADAFNQAGLPTIIYSDYQDMKWSKLLLNIINNASSAILNQPPGQIIARPELFNLEIEALREGVAVMKAQGIKAVKLPGYPVDLLSLLVSTRLLPIALTRSILRPFLLKGRGTKMPSLQIDLADGRSVSELEVLNGAIVRAGQKIGLATPVNRTLTTILSGLVSGRFSWIDYQNRPEKLLEAVRINRV